MPRSASRAPGYAPRTSTAVAAAKDSSSVGRSQADKVCNGVSDDVYLLALLSKMTAGGKLTLQEGRYVITAPILYPFDDIVIEGQGPGTIIDGDGLATGEHAFVISGKTDCGLKNLAVQTEDGGGKVCHCVFIEDGADRYDIDGITIIESDSDGIHVEGTDITGGKIHDIDVLGADGYGVYVNMDALNHMNHIGLKDNTISGCVKGTMIYDVDWGVITGNVCTGNSNEGMFFGLSEELLIDGNDCSSNTQRGINMDGVTYSVITNNIAYNNVLDNILLQSCDYNLVEGNMAEQNSNAFADGIQVDAGSTNNVIKGNHSILSARHGIRVLGAKNIVEGNHVYNSGDHGILVEAADIDVRGNYCYHNGVDAVGTYDGIHLIGAADRCIVNGNRCWDDGSAQEDGIHLEDGAVNCQVEGNYCYNNMGDGIELVANNDYCQINDNYCWLNDDYGIAITAATCNENMVHDNYLYGNVTGQLLDNGTDTDIDGNTGFVDHAYGEDTITAGNVTIVVAHGLAGTPSSIRITPQEAEGVDHFVDTVGAANFTMNITAIQIVDVAFYWRAEV